MVDNNIKKYIKYAIENISFNHNYNFDKLNLKNYISHKIIFFYFIKKMIPGFTLKYIKLDIILISNKDNIQLYIN